MLWNIQTGGSIMINDKVVCGDCETCIINADKFELSSEIIHKHGMCLTVEDDELMDDQLNLVLGRRFGC